MALQFNTKRKKSKVHPNKAKIIYSLNTRKIKNFILKNQAINRTMIWQTERQKDSIKIFLRAMWVGIFN